MGTIDTADVRLVAAHIKQTGIAEIRMRTMFEGTILENMAFLLHSNDSTWRRIGSSIQVGETLPVSQRDLAGT
jgi:hypothetical protein